MSAFLRRNRPLLIALALVAALVLVMLRRYEPRVTASIMLSGLTLGALYFLVASGLSLIFGLMDVLNFAHGVMFMVGAYLGFTAYSNPRLILNILPFALAGLGGVELGGWLMRALPGHARSLWAERVLQGGLWLAASVLLLAGFSGFNLGVLAQNAATSTGGAVATAQAQEAAGLFLRRIVLVALTGVALGMVLARLAPPGTRTGPAWRHLAGGGLLVVLALALIPLRSPGEQYLLGLSSNLRFALALLVGAVGGAGLGAVVEIVLIRPLYSRILYQVLLTLGLSFVGAELVKSVWGTAGFYMEVPAFANSMSDTCPSPNLLAWFSDHCSAIMVIGRPFPSYRLFIIVLGLAMFVAITLLLRRTRLGIIIRAGVQDSEMVQALGINVRQVFTAVFAFGTGLAALGGVAAAPFIGVNLGLGNEVLFQGFISVVIGGMGSYIGAAVGALLVGLARAFGDQLVLSGIQLPGMAEAVKLSPAIARASTVLIMALVLLIRPAGLFGRKE